MKRAFVAAVSLGAGCGAAAQDRADWMRKAQFGVMTHFLAEWIAPEAHKSVKAWNALIDGFDVEGLSQQLAAT